MNTEGFCITRGKGFQITFPNGYTVSVQFGPANYCDNHDLIIGEQDAEAGQKGSQTAETAFWGPDRKLLAEKGDNDCVQGYQTVDQVMQRLIRVYKLPKKVSA